MVRDPDVGLEEFWAAALKIHWGIEAKLSALPGEFDQNFLAQEKNGAKWILKIMRKDCPDWLIKAQVEAIEHLHNKGPMLKVPKVLKSSMGTSFIREVDNYGNERLIWVQTYIAGKCYAEIKQKSTSTSFGVGAALGNIAKALADYKNESLVRDFKWNLPGSLWIKKYFSIIENSDRLKIISKIVDDFEEILPKIKKETDAVINITTGGSPHMTVEERMMPASVFKPELASLNMGSMNFGLYPMLDRYSEFEHTWERDNLEKSRDLVFKNTFQDIETILKIGKSNETRFEFECYDISHLYNCLLYTSPSPRDGLLSRMPSSA